MLSMLLAYDIGGEIVATLDALVARHPAGEVRGLYDFGAIERAGGPLADLWVAAGAAGSGSWPEWINPQGFAVELEPGWSRFIPRGGRPDHRIRALVHRASGHRRERSAIDAAIAERVAAAGDEPADLRDLVGGPGRPLLLDADGRTPVMVRPPIAGFDPLRWLVGSTPDEHGQ